MKKRLAILLLAALLVQPFHALAMNFYLIPDSDTRVLTKEEIAAWSEDSLMYLVNEIFARHGFAFQYGGAFYNYFNQQDWYQEDDTSDHRRCYSRMNSVEWRNEHLIKEVRDEIRAKKRKDSGTKSVWEYIRLNQNNTLSGFQPMSPVKSGRNWPVYSAPTTMAWRGANGKAQVDVGHAWMAAGWENGWLLICYETNRASIRVGYVQPTAAVPVYNQLSFSYEPATVIQNCTLTDDPARTNATISTLWAGQEVTYLTTFYSYGASNGWHYVETMVNSQVARGFIPASCLDVNYADEADTSEYDGDYGLDEDLGDG